MEKIELKTVIPENLKKKRLDFALSELFPEHSRSRIQSWIKEGSVMVNSKNYRQRDLVDAGDVVEINTEQKTFGKDKAESIPLDIIHEDNEIIIVNKPAGLVAHPGAGNQDHTLVNALLNFDMNQDRLPRAGIIHRLDKDTTGLMIIARTIESHTYLVDQLQRRLIKRSYKTIVCGKLLTGGKIENKIGRHPKNRTKMAVIENGKLAITHYRIIKKYKHYTYLDITLDTGRTHQIRVQMSNMKYPIVGDQIYGKNLSLKKDIDTTLRDFVQNFNRQALHAYNLELIHPKTKKAVSYDAELPDDIKNLITMLNIND